MLPSWLEPARGHCPWPAVLYIASTLTTNLPLCAYNSSVVYNQYSRTHPLNITFHKVRRSPQLCIFCTLSLHTFNIILLTKPSSVILLPPVLFCPLYATCTYKPFGREVITRVHFSGDLEFKFVPEAGHPDRAFSPEVNVVIYFKSHHILLVLHLSHILVDPYFSGSCILFKDVVFSISVHCLHHIRLSFYTISLYCLHYFSALFTLLQCNFSLFQCIVYII